MDNNNTAGKKWGMTVAWMIIGLIIGFGAVYGWTTWRGGSEAGADDTTEVDTMVEDTTTTEDGVILTTKGSIGVTATNSNTALLTVNNQPAGYGALIAAVTLPEDGWVVIHEVLENGQVGNAIGAARRDAGTYENVVVELLRASEPNGQYVAVLYGDNGNKVFEISKDKPLGGDDGNPVMRSFTATTPVAPAGE